MGVRDWFSRSSVDLRDVKAGKVRLTNGGKPVKVRSYAGASVGRLANDWRASSADANQEIRGGLEKLRNRSRKLYRDNPYAKGALTHIVNNIVGRGLSLQVQTGGFVREQDARAIEALWWLWNRPRYCDAAGKSSLTQLCRMITQAEKESGEVFLKKVRGFDRGIGVPLQLEILEADHVPVDMEGVYRLPNGRTNRIHQGIELNELNQPVAYWVRRMHPGNYQGLQSKPERVKASDMIHYFRPTRPGQLRGVPALHADMTRLKDLGAYEEAEILAARMSASKVAWLTNKESVGEETPDEIEADWEAGTLGVVPNGYEISTFDPQHPTSQVEGFVRHILRGIAAGLDVSYEAVTRDYSSTTYSSARTAIIPEREMYRSEQDRLGEHVLDRIFEWWMIAAHTAGSLDVAGWWDGQLARERIVEAVRWQPHGWKEIDPLKETNAKIQSRKDLQTTYADIYAEKGQDWREQFSQIAREKEEMQRLGLSEEDVEPIAPGEQEAVEDESRGNGTARTLEEWSFQ